MSSGDERICFNYRRIFSFPYIYVTIKSNIENYKGDIIYRFVNYGKFGWKKSESKDYGIVHIVDG